MKILSINNFTPKFLSKLIRVHLKGTKKFGSKVINRQFFRRKTVFHMNVGSIINFTIKLFIKLLIDLSIGVHLKSSL